MLALQGGALLSQGPTRERFAKKAGQQLNAPPGSVSQPVPPHLPQYAGQQADVLPNMMCANGSIYVSTTSRRSILPFGGPCNPQAILGTHLFAKHRTPPFVKALCLRAGPNRLLGSKNKTLRKSLPC